MKATVKSTLLFLLILSVFASCKKYEITRYKSKELDKMSATVAKDSVYIHDKKSTYKVENASISPAGVKGNLIPVLNPITIAEIKNPQTRKQFKKHKHDLNIYTKTEIKDELKDGILKKDDITDFTRITSKTVGSNIGEDVGTVIVLGIGALLIVGLVYSFQGML